MTPRDVRLAENIVSAIDENMRRNRTTLEEELPSSSPPEMMRSPKRLRRNGSEPIREIASTPDKLPVRSGNRPDSPLFIDSEDDDEEDEYDLEDEIAVNESPMGKQPSETLSEPGYVPQATQGILMDTTQKIDFDVLPPDEDWDDKDAFLREPTQAIDFEVPPPDQGWDDEDSGAVASSESESTATEISDRRPARQGTQAILRGQTAAPDFEVPEPEGGWEHVIPSSPPPIPSSPPAESEVSDVDAQTEAWINTHAVDGISIDQVLSALKCTSMDTDLAEVVLTSVRNYGRIPRDKRGIWTDVDDEDLSSPDARNIQTLESKHGKECLTARWEFLSFYRNV